MRRYAADVERGGDAYENNNGNLRVLWAVTPPAQKTLFLTMATVILMLSAMLINERFFPDTYDYRGTPLGARVGIEHSQGQSSLNGISAAAPEYPGAAAAKAAAATAAAAAEPASTQTAAPTSQPGVKFDASLPTPVVASSVKPGEPAVVAPAPHVTLAPLPPVEHAFPPRPMSSPGVDVGGKPRVALSALESEHASECRARYPFWDHMKLPVPAWRENVFIALNLHNSGHLTGSLHREILRLAHTLSQTPRAPGSPALPPEAKGLDPSCMFVSIYESGSGDSTAADLKKLQAALLQANVPHKIVTSGEVGKDNGHRINGFARIRNAAMAPLYDGIRAWRNSEGKEGWMADRVLFVNDVFWCAEDALRLLAVGDGGGPEDALGDTSSYSAADLSAQASSLLLPPSPHPAIGLHGSVSPPLPLRAPGSRPHMVCGVDYERSSGAQGGFMFYDHWVFRERSGDKNKNRQYPFYTDEFDRAAYDEARRMDVFACWGGIVVIDGSVFSTYGLSLRARTEHCAQSECAHICTDIIAIFGQNAWIQQDNMVATSYNAGVRDELPKAKWFEVKKRLENRRERAELRKKGDVGGCKDVREKQGKPWVSEQVCPAMPYPLAVFSGAAAAYPSSQYCCGEFLQGPVYWMNCHATVTQIFTEAQREKMFKSDFDPFVDLHTHSSVPFDWA